MKLSTILLAAALLRPAVCPAQNPTGEPTTSLARLLGQQATPPDREALLGAMLAEANAYAASLGLPETLPLTLESLTEKFTTPPRVAVRFGTLGSLRTTNYSYGFGEGRHLCYVTRLPKDKSNRSLYERMKPRAIDPSAVNTNAAYSMATQFLARAFVDLPKLAGAKLSIYPMTILKMTTSVYTVEWQRGGSPLAEVRFDQPKAELWSLRVEDPALILRKPLELPNTEPFVTLRANLRPQPTNQVPAHPGPPPPRGAAQMLKQSL